MSGALDGVRVLDLSTGIAGPMAAMLLADFGADVVKVEPATGDPGRSRPGFAMWNRNKRSVVVDLESESGRSRLADLLAGADLCIASGPDAGLAAAGADPATAADAHPGLVYLTLPSFLGESAWAGGAESPQLLAAASGSSLRQSSFDGGPVDPVYPHLAYDQAIWAASAGVAALIERSRSGHGQVVTVGGVHGTMIAMTGSLVIDEKIPEVPAAVGPGGPSAMYSRYLCSDGEWIFMAALTAKFQRNALDALGLNEVLEDERIGGDLEAMLLPGNRPWVRQRVTEVFASRPREEWIEAFRTADCPAGRLLERDAWLDHPQIAAIGMRAEVDDPERGHIVMPANPINLSATPATLRHPAPRLGEHGSAAIDWTERPAPTGEAPSKLGPLAGIRVLDLGTILAGPYAGLLLSELGADVIKVEVPAGDSWRDRGYPYNRGMRGVAIDLRHEEGRAAFYRLVRSADVVLDNYRPGVLGRLGINYEQLREVKPDIIAVSITAFGEGGPFATEPGFDPLLQAMSGVMEAQGGDSEPVLLTIAINDVSTAALATLAAGVALYHREQTGEGQRAWIALAGTAALVQSEELIRMEGRRPPIVGGRDFPGPAALDRSYAVSDGWIRLQAIGEGDLGRLVTAGFAPEAWAATVPGTDDELAESLMKAFADIPRAEALARLGDAGIPAAPARRIAELPEVPEFAQWGIFNVLDRGDGTSVLTPGRYAGFSRTQQQGSLVPPGVGEHTGEVLAEIGFTEAEIADLIAGQAVRQGGPMVYRSFAAYR